MNKKKIIILITGIIMSFSLVLTFAAFMFRGVINGDSKTGTIDLIEKSFLDYSLTDEEIEASPLDKLEALKQFRAEPIIIDTKDKSSITCYATERKGYSDEEDFIYLNQLGFKFSLQANISTYLRIHFEDAWISKKTYNNGNVIKSYITKDKLKGKSPFDASNELWVYDDETGSLYLKNVIEPSSEPLSYEFNIDRSYWYLDKSPSKSFREQILVEVSFAVDAVQANRAMEVWGVDLDTILKGGN